jgi:photosystem II stability/assembly factor-like uncharacterized protein
MLALIFFSFVGLLIPQQQPNQPSGQSTLVIEERSTHIAVRTRDPQVRYRLISGGFISRTTDGGATWNGQLVSPNAALAAGSAPSPTVCWVVGSKGAIYRTTGGITWKKIHSPAPADFTAVSAKDA